MSQTPTVECPTCGAPVEWSPESKFRPFCSDRCKLIDLGAWASEEHKIPVAPDAEDECSAAISTRATDPDHQGPGLCQGVSQALTFRACAPKSGLLANAILLSNCMNVQRSPRVPLPTAKSRLLAAGQRRFTANTRWEVWHESTLLHQ